MPSAVNTRTAFSPSRMRGTFTTTFCEFSPAPASARICAVSVARTSAEIGPSTTSQMAAIAFLMGSPPFESREGLVVTPSTAPIAAASLISPMSPLSMKIFMLGLSCFVRACSELAKSLG